MRMETSMKLLILTFLLVVPTQLTIAIFAGLSAYYFADSLYQHT